MKPRRVILTLEVETDLPLGLLRKIKSVDLYENSSGGDIMEAAVVVHQIQANVIRPTINPTPKKRSKKA